jgi:ubiquinone/menaquinone biosynthesis C-methylase UbiE
MTALQMPFYRDHIYPQIVRVLGDPPPIREVRQRIVGGAEGKVLELGVGPGVNFVHYDRARVSKIYALEPNRRMVELAERQRRRTQLDVEFLGLPGERIPLEDDTVDTVVSTFTLCTIPGVLEALRGVERVLKPGGKLIFFEHGLSPEPRIRRWQERSEPLTRWLFEGCHVTRDIPSLLEQSGFRTERLETGYLARFPRAWTYCWWGTAVPVRKAAPPVAV